MNTEHTEDTESTEKNLTELVIGAAIEVRKELSPGLLESAYTACLAHELKRRGLSVEQEKSLPVHEAQLLSYLRFSGCRFRIAPEFQCQIDERRHTPVY